MSRPLFCKQLLKIQIDNEGTLGYRRDIQGDSGANTSATNQPEILWCYRPYKRPLPLTTYSQDSSTNQITENHCLALGEGIIRLILDDGSVIDFPAMYVPTATGTIISPEHYMHQHEEIHCWIQEASKFEGGHIRFLDQNQQPVATLNMRSKNGLWFTTNQTFVRTTTSKDSIITKVSLPSIPENTIPLDPKLVAWNEQDTTWQSVDLSTLLDPPDPPGMKEFATSNNTWTSHIAAAATLLDKREKEAQITNSMKHLELWHQRMGHIHPRTLAETCKHVEGMPPIPAKASFFKCPFCDKAKMRKRARQKEALCERFHPGTSYHMDFVFISGPANLQEVVNKGMGAEPNLCSDRHGNTAFLLIICAATRYIWVFPVKSKHPPIAIIDQFLKKHGKAHGRTCRMHDLIE